MKKITIILLAVLLLCIPYITAYAETPDQKGTTISATVPATHVITFISNGGRIEDVDSAVGSHKEYGRRSEQTFHIIPNNGKDIDRVLYGGEDVTAQVKDGDFTTPPLVADMVFEVIYSDIPVEPVSESSEVPSIPQPSDSPAKTGDTEQAAALIVAVLLLILSAALIKKCKNKAN